MRQGKSVQSPGYKDNVLNHVDKILYCSWLDWLYIGSIPFKIWYVSAPAWKEEAADEKEPDWNFQNLSASPLGCCSSCKRPDLCYIG